MNKIRIGIDARMFSDSFTGIGRYNFELTKRLFDEAFIAKSLENIHANLDGKDGFEIEWVIFMNDPEFSKFNFTSNVKKVLVDAKHYSFREQTRFLKILKQERCDLVHFTHFNVPLGYFKPFVVTIHDTTISFFPGKKKSTWLHKFVYKLIIRHAVHKSRQIITVSHNTKKDVIDLFKVLTNKIKVIWNGLGNEFQKSDEKRIGEIKKKYYLSDDFLLYTGVWREHKNLVGLIEAFAGVAKNSTTPLNLVITGKADPFYPEVKDTVKQLGLTERVKFVGLVPFGDLVTLYSGAKLFVFPSFYEGFGFPPLEAMMVDTPVAASNTSSIPEVCGEAAVYFDPYDVEDMTSKIEAVLSNSDLQSDLIAKGREQVKNYDWDQCAITTFKEYLKVLK